MFLLSCGLWWLIILFSQAIEPRYYYGIYYRVCTPSCFQKLWGGLENGSWQRMGQPGIKTKKQTCPGARDEWIADTWALNWPLGFPAVVAKGSTPNLQGFYPLNNGKQPHSLREAFSRKQFQAGIYSMGPCTRYCWGTESHVFAVLLLMRNKCPASRWSLDSEFLKG